ncbi:glycosyl hydrolase family 28-related protein [Geodermatophilus sp. SYSU D00684]
MDEGDEGFFDVRDHGAVGDGVHDDTVAVQATIDAAQAAGGGVVHFPAGTYRLRPQAARTVDPADNVDQGHALSVTGSRLVFRGDGARRSRLVFHALDGEPNETSWQVVRGRVWRGGGFFLDGGGSSEDAQHDIAFEDLGMDGTAHRTGDNRYPADARTGDGWDLTHKGLWFRNDRAFDRIRISRCEIHGWKGEVVYYGGTGLGRYLLEDCTLHDTNGDCHSVTASVLEARRNVLHTATTAGFEDKIAEGDGEASYTDNLIHDCDKEALSLASAGLDGPWGPVTIAGNTVRDCPRTGFLVFTSRTRIVDNRLVDCASTSGTQAVYLVTEPGRPLRDVRVERNRIEAETEDVRSGVVVDDRAGAGLHGITIVDNWAGVTPTGVENGVTFDQAYFFDFTDQLGATIHGNEAIGTSTGR